jgi:ATP-dependent helicase/DNAse subunit B
MAVKHTLWRGPLLGNQRKLLVAEVQKRLRQHLTQAGQMNGRDRGPGVIYLVASSPLLTAISQEILDGRMVKGTLDGLPVYLFNGFIRRLLRTARVKRGEGWQKVPRRRDISNEDYPLRRPLIAQLMRQLAQMGQLPAFGSLATARGCVASVARLIGEIIRAGKTAAEFKQIVEKRIECYKESFPSPTIPAEKVHGYELDVARVMQCYATALNGGIPEDSQSPQEHGYLAGDTFPTAAAEKFTESDTNYLRAIAALDGQLDGLPCETPLLDGVEWLIVDGFFDLTPVQGEILRRLIKRIPRVTFNFDDEADNPPVFAAVHETIAKIREMMGDACQEVVFHERVGNQSVTRLSTAPGLDLLRKGLFNRNFSSDGKSSDGKPSDGKAPVFLAVAPDIERELRYIAKTIKHYIHEHSLSPAEIAIVLRDKDTYGAHLRRVLGDEGIAYTFNERLPVTDIPAVRAWLKLVEAAADRPLGETTPDHIRVSRLVDILKSDYFTVYEQRMTADDIENVVAFVGEQLCLADWLKRAERLAASLHPTEPLSAADEEETISEVEEGSEVAHQAPTVRPDAVTAAQLHEVGHLLRKLGEVLAKIPTEGTAADLCQAIEQALKTLNYEPRLQKSIQAALGQPSHQLQATLDLRGLQAIRRAAAAVADAERLAAQSIAATLKVPSHANKPSGMSLGVLLSDIRQALDDLTLRVEPERFGAVNILEATTIRGLHFPVIFVPGMVEGGFPAHLPGDWLYPAAEREQLKAQGLVLEDISPATLVKEEHYFYQVVCRATQAVYLSYPLVGAEDQELVPSSFLAEIQRLVPATAPGETHHTLIPKGYDGAALLAATTRHELLRQAAAAAAQIRRNPPPDPLSSKLAQSADDQLSLSEKLEIVQEFIIKQQWQSETFQQRQTAEEHRYSHRWTPFDGQLEDDYLLTELSRRFGENYVFSATAFNEYATCPFRFFARRVLRLRPRISAALDLQASEYGQILHEILRDFYRKVSPIKDNLEEKFKLVRNVADDIFSRYEQKLPPLNTKVWEIKKSILIACLEQLIVEESLYEENVSEHITELSFGMFSPKADERSVRTPLEITNNLNGRKILLCGQIDRVDIIKIKVREKECSISVVYDYKLSKGISVTDMLRGRDVQLGIYLLAIEKVFPSLTPTAGAGYYTLTKAPRHSSGIYRSEYKEFLPESCQKLEEEDFKETYKLIINHLWNYRKLIEKGSFHVTPARGTKDCQFCDFRLVCRYENHRIQPKKAFRVDE